MLSDCDKAVNTYPSKIEFVPQFVITQEVYDKAVNRYFYVFYSVPNQYKT